MLMLNYWSLCKKFNKNNITDMYRAIDEKETKVIFYLILQENN